MESIFSRETLDTLYPYQIQKLEREIIDFQKANQESRTYVHKVCPKCGAENQKFTGGGKSGFGKHMLKCPSCRHRFVEDSGQLTFYSHQDQSKWDQLIEDTFAQVPETETAAKLDVSTWTVFRMRHKLLHSLEQLSGEEKLCSEVEINEKYVQNSEKGSKTEWRKPRKRGEPAGKRGLSDEKICIVTAVQRLGDSVLQATNSENPSSTDIMKIEKHIRSGSCVWVDGKTAYNELLEKKKCIVRVVGSYEEQNAVDHINNVNSFHSSIDQWHRNYRGVASKYLNRYCSLWVFARHYSGRDLQEILIDLKRRLRKTADYFYIRQIKTEDLFAY